MFQTFYADGTYARLFKTLKSAKAWAGRVGAMKIVSLKSNRVYWLGTHY